MSNLFETALRHQDGGRQRAALKQKYEIGRANLLIAIILTTVNVVLPIFGIDIYMLFSIFTPTFLSSLAMLICGKYPPEYYAEEGLDSFIFCDDVVFYAMIAAAAVITLIYLVLWVLSKGGKVGWLIAATVLFGIDALMIFTLGGIDLAYTLDILFHAWVLYAMISGIKAHYKLKSLPEEDNGILGAFASPPNDFI